MFHVNAVTHSASGVVMNLIGLVIANSLLAGESKTQMRVRI